MRTTPRPSYCPVALKLRCLRSVTANGWRAQRVAPFLVVVAVAFCSPSLPVSSSSFYLSAGEPRGASPPREHWAFNTPARPEVPPSDLEWVRNPIDAFVFRHLQREGLAPSPVADRATLLRRLSLDLIGLPPTIDEVDAFLGDTSSKAYARQVERLLDSPHYGERWARFWLDAARYADSDGYEKDKPRTVWFYRDWVISAFNRDLPYDQFIIEQLAGDELPGATQDQVVATGFLRNSMINEEGGIDPEQFRMEAMFDRMDAIGKSILGLTIQCGQCHDHKYDPLTQEEYYGMFVFLNNDHEANIEVYTSAQQMQRAEIFRQIRMLEDELRHQNPDWRQRMAEWEKQVASDQPTWTTVHPKVDLTTAGGQKHLPLEDGSYLAQGYAPTRHTVKMTARSELEAITAVQLELLLHDNLPRGGPGRSVLGTAALTEIEVYARPAARPGEEALKVDIDTATADLNLPERELDARYDDRSDRRRVTGPIEFAIDGKEETAWGTDAGPGRRNQARKAVFVFKEPVTFPGGALVTFHLSQRHGGWNSDDNQNHNIGRYRLSVTGAPSPQADLLPRRVRELLLTTTGAGRSFATGAGRSSATGAGRSSAQEAAIFSYWRRTVDEWRSTNDRIEALWQSFPEGSTQLVLKPRERPRMTHVLSRGDFLKPLERANPTAPAFLHPLPDGAPATRLTFARWLVDPRSPTTARSIVNRIWQTYFGIGLVASSEDLGVRSERPSHPELLDWLAVEFMERGWSLKALHRLIVDSSTYRQSSRATRQQYTDDPQNRLLARGPRFRVDGEIVRDIMLSASGLLTPRVGGPSVYPPLPEFMLKPPVSYGPKVWNEEKGQNRYRRALYTFRFRSLPFPALQAFDVPNGDFSCVRRSRSNTPLQALTTLNETVAVECARALAARVLEDVADGDDAARIDYAFRRCVSRNPDAAETEELLGLLSRQRKRGATDGESADLAAWTVVSRVLLNLDEAITKE